jgi:SAM-dependent methyltransferase
MDHGMSFVVTPPPSIARTESFAVRLGRALLEWGTPNTGETRYAWKHLAPCRTILDVACGTGSFIAERPSQVIGIDVDEQNVAFCRSRGFDVRLGNALALPFEPNTFDGVHSAHVLFAFQSDKAVRYVKELVRVTRPGGTIVLSTLCDVNEVFGYPEVARPYPPQAVFRMIHIARASQSRVGTEIGAVVFKAIAFRRPPLINFRFSGSPKLWRAADVLNAMQFGCYLRKFWRYRGYTIVLVKS